MRTALVPPALIAATVVCVCLPRGPADLDAAVQVTPADVASAALVAVAVLAVVLGRRRLPPRALVAFGPLIAALGVTTVLSTDVEVSLVGAARFLQVFALVPLAVMLAVRERRHLVLVCGAVLAAGLFEAVYGIVQVATGNGASFGGRGVRAVGTFGAMDIMALATIVGYGLVIALAFLLTSPSARRSDASSRRRAGALTAFLWCAFGVLAVAQALALSRGHWIAVGAALTVMVLLYSRMLALRVAVCAGAVAVVMVGGLGIASGTLVERARSITETTSTPDQSVIDRYSLWSTAAGIWQDHPASGVGVKNFAAYRDTYAPLQLSAASDTADSVNGFVRQPLLSPHNEYLLILSEQGLLGFAGFAVLVATLLWGLLRPPGGSLKRARRDPLWLVAAGFMTALLVDFLYGDLGGPTSVLTSVMIGLTAVIALGPPWADGAAGPGGAGAARPGGPTAGAAPRDGRRASGGADDGR
ncbi:O-antigen ligase family protein [Actinomadura keratinilytica]|jgi:O-antigen ligase|uniref:O-antigen ligase family protein n=2 Tax=Actinomadura keratinilytica TaxID=547461 RepID=A0ABP7YSF9_9ACTN